MTIASRLHVSCYCRGVNPSVKMTLIAEFKKPPELHSVFSSQSLSCWMSDTQMCIKNPPVGTDCMSLLFLLPSETTSDEVYIAATQWTNTHMTG